jgi:glycosyltransferase involved in cell wall biosynthesis
VGVKRALMNEISVIMPLYNAEKFLRESLESYQENAFPGVELIVVDDGSTDRSVDIIRQLGVDARLLRQENAGPATARNLALKASTSKYVAFLDADDVWPPQTLSGLRQVFTADPELQIVQGMVQSFATGKPSDRIRSRLHSEPRYQVNLGSALFRRCVLSELNGFDESLQFDEDTDLWIRCWELGLKKGSVANVTLHYRLHQDNLTSHAKSNARALLPLLKKHRDRMRERKPLSEQSLAQYLGWQMKDSKPNHGINSR